MSGLTKLYGLTAEENEFDDGGASSGEEQEEGTKQEQQRRRKRRKREAADAAAITAAQQPAGEKDHLFFSLKVDESAEAAAAAAASSTPASAIAAALATSLAIYGSRCVLHPDSSVAATLRSESHLQHLAFEAPRVRAENDDEDDATAEGTVSVDRFDVRLLLPPAEWRPNSNQEDEEESLDAEESSVQQQEAKEDKAEAPIEETAIDPSPSDLQLERLSKDEFVELQRERFQDFWRALGASGVTATGDAVAITAMEDVAPPAPSLDSAVSSESQETLDGKTQALLHMSSHDSSVRTERARAAHLSWRHGLAPPRSSSRVCKCLDDSSRQR